MECEEVEGDELNNITMQLRKVCNHPFLMKSPGFKTSFVICSTNSSFITFMVIQLTIS